MYVYIVMYLSDAYMYLRTRIHAHDKYVCICVEVHVPCDSRPTCTYKLFTLPMYTPILEHVQEVVVKEQEQGEGEGEEEVVMLEEETVEEDGEEKARTR